MGTLWLGGQRGWFARNFTQITGADTGFPEGGGLKTFTSTPPPLDIVCVTSSALRKIEKHPHSWTFTSTPPWTLSAWRHPPSGELKNTPPPPLLLPQKRTAAAQKTELPKSWGGGGCSPPGPYAYAYIACRPLFKPLSVWTTDTCLRDKPRCNMILFQQPVACKLHHLPS